MKVKFLCLAYIVALFHLAAQDEPVERLTWNLSEFEDESGAKWSTARFQTIKGALYTLASSPELETWTPVNSFYALGSELNLALFELEAVSQDTSNEIDTPEIDDTDDEPATEILTASLQLRPLADEAGTAVTWRSLDPVNGETLINRTLDLQLSNAWEQLSIYSDLHDQFFIFVLGSFNSPVSDSFQETPIQNRSALDELLFTTLQRDFSTIQNRVFENLEDNTNNPVPAPQQSQSSRFYRLERTYPDSDRDGIPDYIEFMYDEFDPYNSDTNGNGIIDSEEPNAPNPNDEERDEASSEPNLKYYVRGTFWADGGYHGVVPFNEISNPKNGIWAENSNLSGYFEYLDSPSLTDQVVRNAIDLPTTVDSSKEGWLENNWLEAAPLFPEKGSDSPIANEFPPTLFRDVILPNYPGAHATAHILQLILASDQDVTETVTTKFPILVV